MIAKFFSSGSGSSYKKNKSHTSIISFGLKSCLMKMSQSFQNQDGEIIGSSLKNRSLNSIKSLFLTQGFLGYECQTSRKILMCFEVTNKCGLFVISLVFGLLGFSHRQRFVISFSSHPLIFFTFLLGPKKSLQTRLPFFSSSGIIGVLGFVRTFYMLLSTMNLGVDLIGFSLKKTSKNSLMFSFWQPKTAFQQSFDLWAILILPDWGFFS